MENSTNMMGVRIDNMTVKEKIEQAFEQQDLVLIDQLLPAYLEEYHNDYDRFSIQCNYEIMRNNYIEALAYAKQAIELNPYNLDADYNMAYASDCCGDYATAHFYYLCLQYQQKIRKKHIIDQQMLTDRLNAIDEHAKQLFKQGDKELLAQINQNERIIKYSISDPFRFVQDIIGELIFDRNCNGYYVAGYGDWYNNNWNQNAPKAAAETKVEVAPVSSITSQVCIDLDGDYILPFVPNPAPEDTMNNIHIRQENSEANITAVNKKSYYYMKLHGKTEMFADHDMVLAKPIMVKHDPKNKRLVLNLFIDSLNWRVFELAGENGDAYDGMQKLMPNTYDFFHKGMICNHAYVSSEWTTPSISTYMTGVYSDKHMNLYDDIWYPYDDRFKMLTEHFKEQGYVTAMINGNDACTPAKGYIKGVDREIYRESGYPKDQIVIDTLEHLRTFEQCDQFVTLQMEDLHEIAGGFMRSSSVQTRVDAENFTIDNQIRSTVKQSRSLHKQEIYMQELKSIDFYLGLLYDYVQKNYKEEEYIVSLFSDHGTAFLVENDQPIICNQRMHVPMFFRSDRCNGALNEFVQSVDYGKILCHLAGVPYHQQMTDAQLPKKLGGDSPREYVFAQTIFMDDPYQAMITDWQGTFYLRTKEPVNSEYQISLEGAEIWLEDKDGNRVENQERRDRYLAVVMEKIQHLLIYK